MSHRPPRILLRSSWQIVNIGDIAHTPGLIALLERDLPGAEVVLWAGDDLSDEVAAMEHRRFPSLRIVKGRIGADGSAANPDLAAALAWCDVLVHGSGPSLVARQDVEAFVRHVGKPFGVFGITWDGSDPSEAGLLSKAGFVYFRDSVSLERARQCGVSCPVMGFGPDAAFACDLRDDARADAFLRDNGLEDGRFACCIARLRYTPYWTLGRGPVVPERHARNEAMIEQDGIPLRAAVTALVRDAGLKVLVCPEDMTQMEVGRRMLIDRLPPDVLRRVVWRERFWLTDEALSVYRRSAGLFGHEMHSPIMCIGNGIPAIVCRSREQTTKGFMWRDIGLGQWLFDLDQPDEVARIPATVLAMVRDRDAARAATAAAAAQVRGLHRAMVAQVARLAGVPAAAAAG